MLFLKCKGELVCSTLFLKNGVTCGLLHLVNERQTNTRWTDRGSLRVAGYLPAKFCLWRFQGRSSLILLTGQGRTPFPLDPQAGETNVSPLPPSDELNSHCRGRTPELTAPFR